MSTKTGIPTSATFVFVNMLRKLRADFSPQYLAAVFDVSAPTFRDKQATEITRLASSTAKRRPSGRAYEATRLIARRCRKICATGAVHPARARRLSHPDLEMPGFEADDVIGTLAQKAPTRSYSVLRRFQRQGHDAAGERPVCVLNPPKDNLICDAAKVEEILGVPPDAVVDVMALRGDSIDNIPGAPGIGDKGSVELIQRFGTVEGLWTTLMRSSAKPIANRCRTTATQFWSARNW